MYSKQHQEIDSQYQEKLENQRTFEVDNRIGNKPTYYVLDMFAYPSGVGLHLGHALTYTATDIRARSMRLLGYEVLYPVGFDSFGLPTENFAMKVGKSAQRVTTENTDNFREQLKKLAISYDWNREIITSDKDYYKWTQWLVLKLWEHGLLYKRLAPVNWCPNCQTVLANEQVVHGKCERDDAPVEQRQMEQWFVNITKYSDELVDGLDNLDWPEESKKMQKNWIGRKEGFEFFLTNDDGINVCVFVEKSKFNTNIEGVAISIDHPVVSELARNNEELKRNLKGYSQNVKLMGAIDRYERYQERTGLFSGVYLNSTFSDQKIPLFISGNVSSISDAEILYPHSQKRDRVIFDASNSNLETSSNTQVEQSIDEQELLESTGQIKSGKRYRLRDWSISRQRYWGAPMPFLYSSDGTITGVDEKDLPILLPENVQNYKPSGISPLGQVSEFVNSIGKNGEDLKREVDTLDTFVDSAFYYLRYLNPKDSDEFISPEALEKWGDVDMYVGGKEHVTAHLIYARFIHKFLRDAGIVKSSEPFPSLRHQGVVLDSNGVKMSKRLGNVVNPIDIINKYGADTLRVYLMFMGPLSDPHMWDENGIEGVTKFLDKIGKLGSLTHDKEPTQEELIASNKLIQEIKNDTLALKYNTAVSKFMIFVNSRLSVGELSKSTFKTLLILLNPYAPNLTDFLWKEQSFTGDIDKSEFPTPTIVAEEGEKLFNLIVQVNGKTRGIIANISANINEDTALDLIRSDERFTRYIGDQIIKNIVYRAGKIINIVI